MWTDLGFKDSPYNARPLDVTAQDVELLVGRKNEAIRLYTSLSASKDGVYVISGVAGVGKTSFLNIQQYLLQIGDSDMGKKLLSATRRCSVQPKDTAKELAIRALDSLYRSVENYCNSNKIKIPSETKKIGTWITQNATAAFDLNLQILGVGGGFGKQVQVPSLSDITIEGLEDVISCITSEAITTLGFEGVFIVLDNIENLEDKDLSDLLLTFRDTLFVIPHVWWILIGQSGLGSLIHSIDPKIYQRLNGTLELNPLSLPELEEAIQLRVSKFRVITQNNKAPLTFEIHKKLYDASNGEIRFVFRYSEEICKRVVTEIRQEALKILGDKVHKELKKQLNLAIGNKLVNGQISTRNADLILKEIVKEEINGLNLRPKDKAILKRIGESGSIRPRDYENFKLKSAQYFYTNYLKRFYSQHLLHKEQEGKAVLYKLRGMVVLAAQYQLLD